MPFACLLHVVWKEISCLERSALTNGASNGCPFTPAAELNRVSKFVTAEEAALRQNLEALLKDSRSLG